MNSKGGSAFSKASLKAELMKQFQGGTGKIPSYLLHSIEHYYTNNISTNLVNHSCWEVLTTLEQTSFKVRNTEESTSLVSDEIKFQFDPYNRVKFNSFVEWEPDTENVAQGFC